MDRSSSKTGTSTREVENYLVTEVFANSLIFDNITSYLTLSDKKILSQVSKYFLHQVRNKDFGEKAKLIIKKESFDTACNSKFHWKTVSIKHGPFQEKAQLQSLKRILRHVENIEIINTTDSFDMSKTKWVNCLEAYISSCPSLKTLSLDHNLITGRFLTVLKRTRVGEILANLEELRIFKDKWTNIPCIQHEDQAEFGKVIQNLHSKTNKLKAFYFGKVDTRNSEEINQALVDIIDKNKATMSSLTLSIQPWRITKLREVVCPILSKLTVVFKSRDVKILNAFLRNQPKLTGLSLQALDYFPLSLVPTIRDVCSELRELHLKLTTFQDDVEEDLHLLETDWSLLSKIEHLEDFSIIRAVDIEIPDDQDNLLEFVSVSDVLNNLPTKVKKIYIRGLELSWPAEEETTVAIITTLSRFTELTQLSLFECPNVINDEILQFICSNFAKLRVLEFSMCNTLTSFGYTGIRQDLNTGISMKDLKGLKKLTIEDCTLAHPGPLLDSLQFLELVHFELEYDSSQRITKEFVIQFAKQNPALEYLIGSLEFDMDEDVIKSEIKEFHPRFKELRFRVSSGNSDAMTAYGFDEQGNETPWMHGFGDGNSFGSFDLDDDDYDMHDEYDDFDDRYDLFDDFASGEDD